MMLRALMHITSEMLITCAPMLAACTIARAIAEDVVPLLPSLWILVAGVGVLEAKSLAGLADRDQVDVRGDAAVGVGVGAGGGGGGGGGGAAGQWAGPRELSTLTAARRRRSWASSPCRRRGWPTEPAAGRWRWRAGRRCLHRACACRPARWARWRDRGGGGASGGPARDSRRWRGGTIVMVCGKAVTRSSSVAAAPSAAAPWSELVSGLRGARRFGHSRAAWPERADHRRHDGAVRVAVRQPVTAAHDVVAAGNQVRQPAGAGSRRCR